MRCGRNPQWMVFVLGMLFLRALVPAGFMLAPIDGTVAVVLCGPGVVAGHQVHHALGHPAPEHDGHADATCPYAQSAGSAPLPTLPALAGGVPIDVLAPAPAFTQTFLTSGPVRQQIPRGPPALA